MKKYLYTALICVLLSALATSMNAQTVTLAFTGKKNGSNQYVRLTKVVITNMARNWTETIYYPDTILQLSCGVGIEDFETEEGFALSQNIPNPFEGKTDFVLRMAEADKANIAVYDVNGKKITELKQQLPKGIHSFRIMLTTPQAYMLKVHTKKNSGTVKILNTGNAGQNLIEYLGETGYPITCQLEAGKGNSNKPFMQGDLMQYVGYTNYYGTECQSQSVTQAQTNSEQFVLNFSCDNNPPVVDISPVSSITQNSAVCGGDVVSEGTGSVIDRGVCWNTNSAPTINNPCTHDGVGNGSFISQITGLDPGTLYYVRAYARNNVSIAYSSQTTHFYTLPNVVTDEVSNIITYPESCTVTLNGQIWSNTPTTRGFCWSTSPNPTINDNQVFPSSSSDSAQNSLISATVTGLTRGTTYYVRAYAKINISGEYNQPITYGNEVSFMVPDYPTVMTGNVSDITAISATCSGNVTSDGGATVTARGICLSHGQAFEENHIQAGNDTGSFTSNLTNLSPNTTYYVKAYATNSAGTRYGEERSFTTAPPSTPTVTTDVVTNVSETMAICGGNVTNDGGDTVNSRGVCWSTVQNPTTSDNFTFDGSGTGSFSSYITGLTPGTTYYVRAYATNSIGTQYGEQRSFITSASIPIVTTDVVANITDISATCSGNVIFDGGATVTARGACWSVVSNPTLNDSHTVDGSGMGSFTSNIIGLTAGITYYVRTYATNSMGTAYGEEKIFTTFSVPVGDALPCPSSPIVTDFDGNTYNTVLIGNQCWMAENLRTTKYADGTNIPLGTGTYSTTAYRYYPNNSSSNVLTYGYLYNNKAVMRYSSSSSANPSGVQGVCPNGWHVPSDAEWTQLTDYVGSQNQYICGSNNTYIAKALAAPTAWNSTPSFCAIGNNPTDNNATGFGGMPAGYFSGSYYDFGNEARFWSATGDRIRRLRHSEARMYNGTESDTRGLSVRCLRDGGGLANIPAVSTNLVTNIASTSVTCGGDVIDSGSSTVVTRGVCWSPSHNPTVSNSHTADGTGVGYFSSSITGLQAGTTYYVRAYATNSAGTAYGEEKCFTTMGTFTCEVSNVSDIDGNTYNVVQIGSQCWMAENLRTTKYADGTNILLGTDTSSSIAYRYFPHNDSSNVSTYGFLYNWKAVMQNTPSSSVNPSGVLGICPNGWHVPSDVEWAQLTEYIGSQSQYICGNNSSYIAKALAADIAWNNNTETCSVGNNLNNNNATGFGALPAGVFGSSGGYWNFNSETDFWSATEYGSTSAYILKISSITAYVYRNGQNKKSGFSVRCLHNEDPVATLPTVITNTVSNITPTTATCGGDVIAAGNAAVTARGVCWSISQNPTVSDNHTIDGVGTGSFTSDITGLNVVTSYYIRAYATTSEGTSYGEQRCFTTLASTPTVITNTVSNITPTSATCGGSVTATGGADVTARGVCWSTSQDFSLATYQTTDGNGMGSFTSNLSNLTPSTTYYVKAYATNSAGTSYGEVRSFTSSSLDGQPCLNTATVTDYDGNVYNTVQVGSQCWMKQYMHTTHYADGTSIPAGGSNISSTTPYYYISLGYLYNWPAAMHGASSSSSVPSGVQGICPTGWHLPSDAEWTVLTNYVGSHAEYICGGSSDNIAKALSSTSGWNTSMSNCSVGNNQSENNATGFSAVPTGYCDGSLFYSAGLDAYFWSATQDSIYYNGAYNRYLNYYNAGVSRGASNKDRALSVRCLRD